MKFDSQLKINGAKFFSVVLLTGFFYHALTTSEAAAQYPRKQAGIHAVLFQATPSQAAPPAQAKPVEPSLPQQPGSWLLESYRSGGIRGLHETYYVVSDGTVFSNGKKLDDLSPARRQAITKAIAQTRPFEWKKPKPEPSCCDRIYSGWILKVRLANGSERTYRAKLLPPKISQALKDQSPRAA